MLQAEQIDGVVVAVPHTRHFEIALDALRRGLHVLLEKPMVLTSDHARELLRAAAEHDRQIVVGYPWHYNEQVNRARDWIASGAIGNLLYVHSLFASIVWELYGASPKRSPTRWGTQSTPPVATPTATRHCPAAARESPRSPTPARCSYT